MEAIMGKTLERYVVANAAAIAMGVFLSLASLAGAILGSYGLSALYAFLSVILLALLLLFVGKRNIFPELAFRVPIVLLALNSLALANEWHSNLYLLVCLFICAVSCLYNNFSKALAYALVQTAVIATLHFSGVSVVPYGMSYFMLFGIDFQLVGITFFSLLSCAILLIITKDTTVSLRTAGKDANSFRTYLATTQDYLAMLDKSNRIVYVSKSLSDLVRSEDPDLAKGRPFIDLFPGRELKFLAYRMLGHRNLYEENWEFVLDKQKRYFKAVSNAMQEGSIRRGTLITLLDMTHLAERDEIAAMKDSLQIGLFFMNRDFVIQDNYSRFLEEVLSEKNLKGKCFTDILAASLSSRELDAIKDYFNMVFDHTFDAATLSEINPLHELRYMDPSGAMKIFNCEFLTVELGKGEAVILVTIYDITTNVELRERLQKEEKKRQEEMSSLFELLQVEPATFDSFQEDMEHEFDRIDKILRNNDLSRNEALVEVYQAIHAIKSNAVTLGLNNFGSKAHEIESEIKRLRDIEGEVHFDDMLHLTFEIERLAREKDGFKQMLEEISAFKIESDGPAKSAETIFLESLSKTVERVAADTEKKVRFVAANIEMLALEETPKRSMRQVLMQLVRNAVMHGIESPEERISKGKNETGAIRLSIKHVDKNIHVKLSDDGKGFDFDGIRKKAESMDLIKEGEIADKSRLLEVVFSPGFSTAESEDGIHAGRGIGLNLVRDWVRDAGGSIKLQTELGKGTIFNVFIPAESAKSDEAADEGSQESAD